MPNSLRSSTIAFCILFLSIVAQAAMGLSTEDQKEEIIERIEDVATKLIKSHDEFGFAIASVLLLEEEKPLPMTPFVFSDLVLGDNNQPIVQQINLKIMSHVDPFPEEVVVLIKKELLSYQATSMKISYHQLPKPLFQDFSPEEPAEVEEPFISFEDLETLRNNIRTEMRQDLDDEIKEIEDRQQRLEAQSLKQSFPAINDPQFLSKMFTHHPLVIITTILFMLFLAILVAMFFLFTMQLGLTSRMSSNALRRGFEEVSQAFRENKAPQAIGRGPNAPSPQTPEIGRAHV